MPFDLMAHNRELDGTDDAPKRRPSYVAAPAAKSAEQERAEQAKQAELAAQMEAMRKLDALQLGAPKAKPKPTVDPRPTRPSAPETPQSPHSPQRPDGEWRCKTCSTREAAETHGDCTCPADFKFCPTCGEAAGAGVPSDKPPNPVSGDWDCPDCNEPCSAMFSYCVECGGVHPPPPPHDCAGCGEVMPHSWKFCPDCGTAATVDKVERGCKPPETTGEEADWTCTKCKDEIPGGFNFCQECGEARH